MVRMKKKVTTISVGLSKSGKSGERRSTVHSRTVPFQSKIKKKSKGDEASKDKAREGRNESPSRLMNKNGRRTTTVTAPLPASYHTSSAEKEKSELLHIQAVTSDACIDLDELANIEIDKEKGTYEYVQDEIEISKTASCTDKSSENSAAEATFDENNALNVDVLKDKASQSVKSVLNKMDAAVYALGKFVGESTCHEPSFDVAVPVPEEQSPDDDERSEQNVDHPTQMSAVKEEPEENGVDLAQNAEVEEEPYERGEDRTLDYEEGDNSKCEVVGKQSDVVGQSTDDKTASD